jgi:hypothetical protein
MTFCGFCPREDGNEGCPTLEAKKFDLKNEGDDKKTGLSPVKGEVSLS